MTGSNTAENNEVEKLRENFRQFTYTVSHDLSAPLRSVVAFTKLMQEHCASNLDERGKNYLSFVVSGGEKAQAMVEGLLQYSRLNTLPYNPMPVNTSKIAEEAIANLDDKITESNARIEIGRLPVLTADYGQMMQLFSALISNAAKYHKPDAAPEIHINAEKVEKVWKFTVEDNGIGIDPRFHKEIFNVFRRLHRDEEFSGVGMGLALAKKIIELHGGTIGVESVVGGPTVFFFTLVAQD